MNSKSRRFITFGTIAFALTIGGLFVSANRALALGPWCTSPYVQVQDGATPLVPDQTGQFTIQSVSIGEPFAGCSNKTLKVVMKVQSMDPGNTGTAHPPPNGVWTVAFTIPGSANSLGTPQQIFLQFDTTFVPTGGFNYGWLDAPSTDSPPHYPGGFNCSQCVPGVGACAATGTIAPDGTITMNLNFGSTVSFGTCDTAMPPVVPAPSMSISPSQWTPGTILSNIQGNVQILVGAVGTGEAINDASTVGNGEYTLAGNLSCSNPPVAALGASTNSGPAPLTVNFDATASTPGQCGTINSYIFNFGDGSPQVTQATPTISHIYNTGGATYPARVRVTSTSGLTSSNIAEQDITVTNAGPPLLVSVVSRKTHGALLPAADLVLSLSGAPTLEPRVGGIPSGNHTLVFTFLNPLTGVGSVTATATTSGGPQTIPSANITGSIQTDPRQYKVDLTGVPNASHLNVVLHSAADASNNGDVTANMDVLFGDVNASKRTDAGDVTAVRNRTVTIPDTTNPASFLFDVNASGRIDAGDVTATRNATVTVLP